MSVSFNKETIMFQTEVAITIHCFVGDVERWSELDKSVGIFFLYRQ